MIRYSLKYQNRTVIFGIQLMRRSKWRYIVPLKVFCRLLFSSVDSEGGKTPKSIDSALQSDKKLSIVESFSF